MADLKKFTDNIEFLFSRALITGLRDNTMSPANAKAYAIEFLKIEPFASVEDAQKKVASFTTRFPLFKELHEYADAFYNEQKIENVIAKMQKHLKNKDVDSALQAAQET